jgi:hypothetical protein
MEGKDKDLEKEEDRGDDFHEEGENGGHSYGSPKPFSFEEEGYW